MSFKVNWSSLSLREKISWSTDKNCWSIYNIDVQDFLKWEEIHFKEVFEIQSD